MKYKYLNVGCGTTWRPDWINIDLNNDASSVLRFDIKQGIPYSDNYFDAVYYSHLLEHLSKSEGEKFIAECTRVLKKGGIIRIAVPDLESIAKEYLKQLNSAWRGNVDAQKNYEWIYLELYDQVTRVMSGGDMEMYLHQKKLLNKSYIRKRLGLVANQYFKGNSNSILQPAVYIQNSRIRIFRHIARLILKEPLVNALDEALFRNTGELHKVMYDKYSLKKLLICHGFHNVTRTTAFKSGIANFNKYNLDTFHGKVRKADSLFMEAIKS